MDGEERVSGRCTLPISIWVTHRVSCSSDASCQQPGAGVRRLHGSRGYQVHPSSQCLAATHAQGRACTEYNCHDRARRGRCQAKH